MPFDTPPAIIMPDFDATTEKVACIGKEGTWTSSRQCWTIAVDRRTGCTWFIPIPHGSPTKYACPGEGSTTGTETPK